MKLTLALLVLTACASDTFTSADAGPDVAATCPDESGKYTIVFTGAGCGGLSATAACATQSACNVTLGNSSVNGTFTIDANGDFTNGAIKEGSNSRTGCVGTWDAPTSTLTVDCGSFGNAQSCRATLTRASTCN